MDNNIAGPQPSNTATGLVGEARKKLRHYIDTWRRSSKKDAAPKLSWKERFSLLTLSQWTYFFALLALIVLVEDGEWSNRSLTWVGLIAAVGISREIWQLFHRLWNTTLGKGVFLVLYAATANFAIAIAALKVNNIAGIEPAPLRFTLGFTTLIMLPMWIFIASVIMAVLMLMLGNLWLMLVLLLRVVRIRLPTHWEDRSFAILTMFLRLILLPIVILALYFVIKPYADQLHMFDTTITVVDDRALNEQQKAQLDALNGEAREAFLVALAREGVVEVESMSKKKSAIDKAHPGWINIMIASFIYEMETYPYSACAKREEERVLTIDDYSMLVATKDDSPLGVSFSVKPCVPVYSAPEQNSVTPP